MFEIGWTELMLIGIVALIVIGPKDLPDMFRTMGRFTAKLRSMARDFQRAMDQAAKESGVNDIAADLKAATSAKSMGLDAVKGAASRFEKWDPLKPAATPAAATPAAATPAAATPAAAPVASPTIAAQTVATSAPTIHAQTAPTLAGAQAAKTAVAAKAATKVRTAKPAPIATPKPASKQSVAKPIAAIVEKPPAKPRAPRKLPKDV